MLKFVGLKKKKEESTNETSERAEKEPTAHPDDSGWNIVTRSPSSNREEITDRPKESKRIHL